MGLFLKDANIDHFVGDVGNSKKNITAAEAIEASAKWSQLSTRLAPLLVRAETGSEPSFLWESKGPLAPPNAINPQEIAGPKSRPFLRDNQWLVS